MARTTKQSSGTIKITTNEVVVVGFNSLKVPSTMYDAGGVYSLTVLMTPEEALDIKAKAEQLLQKQRKEYGGQVQEITRIKPYVKVEKDKATGKILSETPDELGRYGFKLDTKAYIKDGEPGVKILLVDSKGQPILNDPKLSDGSVIRCMVVLEGYTVAGKTGVSVKLKAVQVIAPVKFGGVTFADTGFGVYEGGYAVDEDAVEESTTTEEVDEEQGF